MLCPESRSRVTELPLSSRLPLWSLCILIALSGCDRFFLPKPPQTQEGAYLVHVVSGGDVREDISTILLWYTGSEDNASAVQVANPGIDLSELKAGQRIVIPSNIVTQTNAMPRRKFTLGVDVVQAPQPIRSPEVTTQGKRSDPLEELMRQNEKVASPTTAMPESLHGPGQVNPVVGAPSVDVPARSNMESRRDVVSSGNKKGSESRRLESFSDDEIGVLPAAPPAARERADVSGENAPGPNVIQRPSPEIKNPRPRRQLQPEVFDEE